MRKLSILIAAFLIFSITGCDVKGKTDSKNLASSGSNEMSVSTVTETSQMAVTPAFSSSIVDTVTTPKAISIEDFDIKYNNILINDNEPFEKIADSLGIVIGSEDGNSELRASTSVNGMNYRWITVHYPSKKNEELRIQYVINDTKKTEYLVYVDLFKVKTNREVCVGDDLAQLIREYGDSVKADFNTSSSDLYQYNLYSEDSPELDKMILIVVDKNTSKVSEISIDYNQDKAMNELDITSFD